MPFHASMAISSPTAASCSGDLGASPHAKPTPPPRLGHIDLRPRQLTSTTGSGATCGWVDGNESRYPPDFLVNLSALYDVC